MDLGAYANIGEEEIDEIVKENGIEVPRLRGYRLMVNEEPVDLKEIWTKQDEAFCCRELCESLPFWTPYARMSEGFWRTDRIKRFYLYPNINEYDGKSGYLFPKDIRWERIHGWKRKVLKTYIKNEKKHKIDQYKIWNKYAGRKDILYIHSRTGGGNWSTYAAQVINQPWFLEKVDDSFDCTYCDIYARLSNRN